MNRNENWIIKITFKIKLVIKVQRLQYYRRRTMNTLYDEIWKYIFLFQIFALCPFGRNDFQNYILGFYSLITFIAVIILAIVGMFVNNIIYDNNTLSAIVGGIVFLGEITTHLIIILHAFLSRKDLKKVIGEIIDIDDIFENKLHRPMDYQALGKKYFSKYVIIMLISKGILVFLLIFFYLGSRKTTYTFWLHSSFSIVAVNMRCIQNIFFVDLLNNRLKFLNLRLADISQRHTSKKSKLIIYVESYDPRNPLQKLTDEFNEIMALKQIYGMIWNASNLLNDCFGWSVLVIVTRSFIGFTSHGYWSFLGFEKIIDSEYIVDSATFFILTAFLLLMLCLSCYNCSGCVS